MLQVHAAAGGEALDGRVLIVRVLAGRAQRRVDHRQHQPVANAAIVDLQTIDLEAAHEPVDDRQAGHDDVGPIGAQARHVAAGLGRHFAQPVEQVPHFGVRYFVAAQRQAGLSLGGHDHFGQRGECAARADQQVRAQRAASSISRRSLRSIVRACARNRRDAVRRRRGYSSVSRTAPSGVV